MTRALLSLNAGSSSIKFAVFALEDRAPVRVAAGKLEGVGTRPRLVARSSADRRVLLEREWAQGAELPHEAFFRDILAVATDQMGTRELAAVAHRVVHGGSRYVAPMIVDDDLLKALEALDPLAPLHQPHNLAAIAAMRRLAPQAPQIACFDTAFHAARPQVAVRFALPRRLHDEGVRRYGFHGLSYDYLAGKLRELDPQAAQGRVIAAHLGNGASLCAMRDGVSIDTTMGFTALDGLVMGTRCGGLDPGVVLHLLSQMGMSLEAVQRLLYRESGLLGVSGVSSDMRDLHASGSPEAREAIELFVWRAARETGALASSLGGLDAVVFSAGIGENDPVVRAMICERLAWLGVEIDAKANGRNAPLISTPGSRVTVRVIPTDEELMMATQAMSLLAGR